MEDSMMHRFAPLLVLPCAPCSLGDISGRHKACALCTHLVDGTHSCQGTALIMLLLHPPP
eukprot:1159344-Pelagomonas_calceolata.AAC.7